MQESRSTMQDRFIGERLECENSEPISRVISPKLDKSWKQFEN